LARLYANENFPQPVVETLRHLGHDVLTTHDTGHSGKGLPDSDVLRFAVSQGRARARVPDAGARLAHVAREPLQKLSPGVGKRLSYSTNQRDTPNRRDGKGKTLAAADFFCAPRR
jgi:hypothetical protein